MSLETTTERIRKKLAAAPGLKARFKFDFDDEGTIFVDTTQDPPTVANTDEEADVTLVTALSTFEKILDGAQDPNIAFMMGKLKVKGSMGLARKLNGILEE